MNRTIEITVDRAGKATVETRGFTGGECRDASRFVEQALGARVAEALTPEYYRQDQAEPPLTQPS